MHDSLESEGSVTLANWKRILKLHFLIRFLGKDGTFRYTIHKEKYKEYRTEIGFEVSRILKKTLRKKSREMRAKHSFEEPGTSERQNEHLVNNVYYSVNNVLTQFFSLLLQ